MAVAVMTVVVMLSVMVVARVLERRKDQQHVVKVRQERRERQEQLDPHHGDKKIFIFFLYVPKYQ